MRGRPPRKGLRRRPRGSAAEERQAPLEAPPGRRGRSVWLAAAAEGDVVEAAEAQEALQAAERGRMHPKVRVEKEATRAEDTAGRCARTERQREHAEAALADAPARSGGNRDGERARAGGSGSDTPSRAGGDVGPPPAREGRTVRVRHPTPLPVRERHAHSAQTQAGGDAGVARARARGIGSETPARAPMSRGRTRRPLRRTILRWRQLASPLPWPIPLRLCVRWRLCLPTVDRRNINYY